MKRKTRKQLEVKIQRAIKKLQKERDKKGAKSTRAKYNFAVAELMNLLI